MGLRQAILQPLEYAIECAPRTLTQAHYQLGPGLDGHDLWRLSPSAGGVSGVLEGDLELCGAFGE